MNRCSAISLATILVSAPSFASDWTNPLFGYTHIQPSPLTLPAGKAVFGSSIGIGATDFLEVGTNLVADIYQTFNANVQANVLDTRDFAFALNLGWQNYNPSNYSLANPNVMVNSWLPGSVASVALAPTLAAFIGGNLNFTSVTQSVNGVDTSGYVHGASTGLDLSWAYQGMRMGRGGVGNVLSLGATYDFTYQMYGVGISHHWRGLHLGVHYYPNASQYKVFPILAGGTIFTF